MVVTVERGGRDSRGHPSLVLPAVLVVPTLCSTYAVLYCDSFFWRCSMVAGTPAKIVGTLQEDTPSLTMKHGEENLLVPPSIDSHPTVQEYSRLQYYARMHSTVRFKSCTSLFLTLAPIVMATMMIVTVMRLSLCCRCPLWLADVPAQFWPEDSSKL